MPVREPRRQTFLRASVMRWQRWGQEHNDRTTLLVFQGCIAKWRFLFSITEIPDFFNQVLFGTEAKFLIASSPRADRRMLAGNGKAGKLR